MPSADLPSVLVTLTTSVEISASFNFGSVWRAAMTKFSASWPARPTTTPSAPFAVAAAT